MSIKLSKSVLKTPLINLINQLDQRVISTLTGTGNINQVVPNGVLMVHTVLITLETCQLKSLLDLTHQHLLQSLLFFFKQVLDGLSSLTVVTKIHKPLLRLTFQTLPKLLANGDHFQGNLEEVLNEE